MAKLREMRLPEEPKIDRKGNAIPVTRVILVDDLAKDYRNAPGTREMTRRRKQNAHSQATAG